MGIPCSGGADHSAIEHQVGLAFETSRCLTVLHICHVYSRSDPGHSFDDTISSSSDLSPSDIVASTSGTCPGLTLVYSHLDIFIQRHELDIVYVIGPGHGAPAIFSKFLAGGLAREVLSQLLQGRKGAYTTWSAASASPAAFPAISTPKPLVRSMKAGNSDMLWRCNLEQ